MSTLPTVVTAAGLQPQQPIDVRADLTERVAATNPGYTNTLPGGLIEDIASTDVAAILMSDAARVDAVNSLTPLGINAFFLAQLGQQFGISIGVASNTSVFVQFTGTPGFVVAKGFTVSDGTYQYTVQDGAVVGADNGSGLGTTPLTYCVATVEGTWAVPSGTVTSLITSVPVGFTLTVTNPQAGIPSEAAQSEESYRVQVLAAGLASAQGMTTMLKALLNKIDGVQSRLVAVQQVVNNGGWRVIVGGGDPYQIAYAITSALFDINTLVGSVMSISAVTQANPGVVTTVLNHGLTTGTVVRIFGATGMTIINNTPLTITVIDQKRFSIGFDTSPYPAYTGGGYVTPNPRNIVVSIVDYPDTYTVPFISPPQQSVTMTLIWNTISVNFVSDVAVAQLGAPALADYINSVVVGQPINIFQMESVFKAAIAGIIDPSLVTRMVFSVSINGVGTSPVAGTGIVQGDPESYFQTTSGSITIVKG